MTRRISLCILCLFILSTLTGCWGSKDLSELSILSAYGIDKTEDGKVMVTVQIIKPTSFKSSGSGGGGGGGGDKKSFVVESNTSDTVFGAVRGMLSKVNKKIFFSSAQIIVIGDEMAKSGIVDYIDFMLRDHETINKTQVIVSKNATAKKILEQEYDLSQIPGTFILDTIKNAESHGYTKEIMMIEMARDLKTPGKELSVGTIEKIGEMTTTEGLAVFQKDKMVGWLNKYETRGYMYITNQIKNIVIEINDPQLKNKKVAIEIKHYSAKIEMKMGKNNLPEANIKIKYKGTIAEQSNSKIKDVEYCKAVNQALQSNIKEEVQKTIERCQKEYKSDIFGFGMHTFSKYPKYWSQSKEKWNTDIFPNLKVNINVDGAIIRTGLLGKSLEIM